MDLSPKVIGSDYPIIVSGDFGLRECGRIVSSLDLSPKVIRRLSSSCCGLEVVVVDNYVSDRKIKVLLMMLLKVLMMTMMIVLIERSECDDDVAQRIAATDDVDQKVKILLMMMLLIED